MVTPYGYSHLRHLCTNEISFDDLELSLTTSCGQHFGPLQSGNTGPDASVDRSSHLRPKSVIASPLSEFA
jgi:hypothetical protein